MIQINLLCALRNFNQIQFMTKSKKNNKETESFSLAYRITMSLSQHSLYVKKKKTATHARRKDIIVSITDCSEIEILVMNCI